ncbi:MAG TPA: response regulator [Desulfotignum sp.]|nr:response regulator [Desulfotignum sp.]
MIQVVLVGKNQPIFEPVARVLQQHPVVVSWIKNGKTALEHISDTRDKGRAADLLITDETLDDMTGRDLVEQVTMESPMTSCVAVSALSEEAFHEAFEGLGVLLQLPVKPDTADGDALVACMKKISLL